MEIKNKKENGEQDIEDKKKEKKETNAECSATVMWNSKIQNPFTETIDFQLEIAKESKLVAGDVASINLPSQVSITNDSGFLIDHSVTILDTSVENEINGMESKGPSEDEIPNFVSSTPSGSRNIMPQDLYFSDIDDSNSDNETIYNIHLPSMELVAPKIAGLFICGCKRPFITKLMYQLHSEKCIKGKEQGKKEIGKEKKDDPRRKNGKSRKETEQSKSNENRKVLEKPNGKEKDGEKRMKESIAETEEGTGIEW
ncbi:uncharacterized protein LOC130625651 [Hydractinia symbiolongicarpus]|uniref:uncharacterized protein LOC130625651 n=1 Tax=Hydractinia symbiolongicarpus TaxID=13093 RepID=UPI00255179EF|nr:uncharacterized protein LOC130625651 [Hydractinia symbiolongicarpus]